MTDSATIMKEETINSEARQAGKSYTDGPHICSHRHSFMLDNWGRKLLQNPVKIVGEYIKKGDTVIDIGCGPGFFTTEMARLVGPEGKVIAADLQEEMLDRVRRKALSKKVADRIQLHKCGSDRVGLQLLEKDKADFILAYYMIHETPDPAGFLTEVKTLLKKGGKLLVVEPKIHVSQELYEEMISQARSAGFEVAGYPAKKGGRAVLFTI